jgi:hypothetical protein
MTLSEVRPIVQSVQPATELIALALLAPEVARRNLRALMLSNPDYFTRITGNSLKAVLRIDRDTTFESIDNICYSSHDELLQATIRLNRSGGYSGAEFGNASQEYVRFYLSYDGGASWRDQGLHAVKVYDVEGPKPMRVTVSMGIQPALTFCFMQNLPIARVILSWNSAPPAGAPDWAPLWGEVLDTQITIDESSVEKEGCREKQVDRPFLKEDLKSGEAMMHSAILESTIETSRLRVLGLAGMTEHYRVPIRHSCEMGSKASSLRQ